jgi:hypothetical protein
MTWPAVTLLPSSTDISASWPGYFDETSTWVTSVHPSALSIPSGKVYPRRRATNLRSGWGMRGPNECEIVVDSVFADGERKPCAQ